VRRGRRSGTSGSAVTGAEAAGATSRRRWHGASDTRGREWTAGCGFGQQRSAACEARRWSAVRADSGAQSGRAAGRRLYGAARAGVRCERGTWQPCRESALMSAISELKFTLRQK
jgi:hypothetical protein